MGFHPCVWVPVNRLCLDSQTVTGIWGNSVVLPGSPFPRVRHCFSPWLPGRKACCCKSEVCQIKEMGRKSLILSTGQFHLANSHCLECHISAGMGRGGRSSGRTPRAGLRPPLLLSPQAVFPEELSTLQPSVPGDGAQRRAVPRWTNVFSHLAQLRAWCRMYRGLVSTGSLSSCSNLSICISLKAGAFCKMQPLLEVTPWAFPVKWSEVLKQLDSYWDKCMIKAFPPPPLPRLHLDPMISSLFEMIQQEALR